MHNYLLLPTYTACQDDIRAVIFNHIKKNQPYLMSAWLDTKKNMEIVPNKMRNPSLAVIYKHLVRFYPQAPLQSIFKITLQSFESHSGLVGLVTEDLSSMFFTKTDDVRKFKYLST